MTAVSSSSVATDSNVGAIPPSACPKVCTPSNGDSPSSAAVITKKWSQPSASWKPVYPSSPIGSSGVPWKQK